MEVLPYLLAGPIVRRVEKTSICIWIATSEKPSLELELNCNKQAIPVRHIKTPAVQLGKGAALWISLLRVKPDQRSIKQFPVDQLIHYKILNKATTPASYLDLSDVCYAGEESPSFFITSQLNTFAFGSCRKPHGFSQNDKGEFQSIDSLALLGETLQNHFHNLAKRPALVCLIGDQIYADDVIDPVIDLIREQVTLLFPEPETLPDKLCGLSSDIGLGLSLDDCHKIRDDAGFSSGSKNAHLLTFSEYASMYLYVFGNRCELELNIDLNPENDCPQVLSMSKQISPKLSNFFAEKLHHHEERNKDYQHAEKSLRGFHASLAKVRKLLANIPTYMIFDDHDVTDDWNISRLWYDNVRRTNNGTRLVSNALAAYWAFQAWGNDPDKFSKAFIKNISDHLLDLDDEDKAKRYDFYLWKWHRWNFVIPCSPPIIALDTRTQRDFGGYNAPPKLLNRYGIDQLRADWLELNRKQKVKNTPLIISATPVFGFSPIEFFQKLAYKIGLFFGNQTGKFTSDNLDLESWIASKQGFSNFLNALSRSMKIPRVIFLSGDVHYAFVHKGRYKADNDELNYLQLTSSAMRNTPKDPRFFARFLRLKMFTKIQGLLNPETLPWWKRIFWHLFKSDRWSANVEECIGKDIKQTKIGRTSRPNIGLVTLKDGEIDKFILLSGDENRDDVLYCLNSEP